MDVTVTKHNPVTGESETVTGNLKEGDMVAFQGDVGFRWLGVNVPKGREAVQFTSIVAAHGESQNTHVLTATDRSVGLQWLKQASEAPSTLTQFAYGQLPVGTEVLVRVPVGGSQLSHEEHGTIEFLTPGVYGVSRQQEIRGVERWNTAD
jgi:hypothetical protein